MKVRYQAFRTGGVDMKGKVVDMDEAEAATLIKSNIVVPVVEANIETATAEPPENAMIKQPERRKGHGSKTKNRSKH